MTEVILLERVENLGQMGEVVRVKPGFARNYLLPQQKALRATKANIAFFETQKKQLEAENLKKKQEAEKVAKKLAGVNITLVRAAGEAGQLYGSATTRDIAAAVTEAGIKIARSQVQLNEVIKALGLYKVTIRLHAEVSEKITLNVARSEEEAAMQLERGAAITSDLLEKEEQAAEAAEALQQQAEALREEAEAAEGETETETEDEKTA